MTQLLDLRMPEELLWTDVKSSFKRYIRMGHVYHIEWYDAANITMEHIEASRNLYEEDAGRVTRNSELFSHYYSFIKRGHGVLGIAQQGKNCVAAVIATCFHKTAYYSVYAEREELLKQAPAGHILQWELMKYLKRAGIEFYEIGEQHYGRTHYSEADEKLIRISHFKRGFGGYTVAHFKGMKQAR